MTSMLRLELVGVLLLSCTQILSENRDFYGSRKQYGGYRGGFGGDRSHHGSRTREIEVKYGRLRGMVVQPRADSSQLVDVFLGLFHKVFYFTFRLMKIMFLYFFFSLFRLDIRNTYKHDFCII